MASDERQARIDAIRRTHVPETDSDVVDVDFGPIVEIGPYCAECGDEWPCEQGLLLSELESIQALLPAIEKANQTLDWIEKRDGPLPGGGYARIECYVWAVRALRGVALKAVETEP